MRENDRREFPFYRQELPWRLPLFSLSDFGQRQTRDRKTGEREREREKLDTLIPGFPLNMN
jgi:hypothetical protein